MPSPAAPAQRLPKIGPAERIGAFLAQVPRERGLERVIDLFGRSQEAEG